MLKPSDDYVLTIRQAPERAKVAGTKEKGMMMVMMMMTVGEQKKLASTHADATNIDRKPVDPPPIIQLQIRDATDPAQ